jgi:sigma-54 dependent transcriptional regulator, acetoin dehydrogenase operon transcriptional activator AcoR
MVSQTRLDDEAPTAPDPPSRPYLVRALACDRPTAPPSRWSLTRVADVVLSGEGPVSSTRTGTLTIASNDPWASSRHAVLRRNFGRWFIEDLDSKNGTLVNGERISRRQLEDGDLIETGRTIWWFRELAGGAPPPDLVELDLAAPFITLHAPLEVAVTRAIAGLVAGLPVLVEGESGVGKERLVAAVHAGSRRPGAMVAVHCGALVDAFAEKELFGYRRGAYADATDDRTGYLRAAHRGTLFLDEIADMPPAAQAALRRALAERAVTPIGEDKPTPVDLAVVSTTHRDVHAMVRTGTFRADLLARLRGVSLWVPPLRERREDIGMFVARTIARVAPGATLQIETARRLLTAPWPLNVRELEHVVAAAVLRAGPRPVAPSDLDAVAALPPATALASTAEWSPSDAALRARLVNALASHDGNISAIARELGRDRKQIHRWIARLEIDLRDPH